MTITRCCCSEEKNFLPGQPALNVLPEKHLLISWKVMNTSSLLWC